MNIIATRTARHPSTTVVIKSRFEREHYHVEVKTASEAMRAFQAGVVDLGFKFGDMDNIGGFILRDGMAFGCVALGEFYAFPKPVPAAEIRPNRGMLKAVSEATLTAMMQ